MDERVSLNRDLVLDAALAIIDAEGLDALTMRHLAQQLGCTPMALYRYAANRADLLDAVVEQVFSLLVIDPNRHDDDWQQQLRTIAHQFRALAIDHPNVVALLATRPLATPLGLRPLGTLRPLEQILALLDAAGFTPADALHVYRSYYGLLLGHTLTELQELVANPDETDALLRLGLHRLPPKEFPHIRTVADDLATYNGGAELDHSITILLTGLAAEHHENTRTG